MSNDGIPGQIATRDNTPLRNFKRVCLYALSKGNRNEKRNMASHFTTSKKQTKSHSVGNLRCAGVKRSRETSGARNGMATTALALEQMAVHSVHVQTWNLERACARTTGAQRDGPSHTRRGGASREKTILRLDGSKRGRRRSKREERKLAVDLHIIKIKCAHQTNRRK